MAVEDRDAAPARGEGVVLIHGMGLKMQGVSMRPLAARLRAAGYGAAPLVYPSYELTQEQALAFLRKRLPDAAARFETCHLVGHSLGGVLALRLMDDLPTDKRGRIVQIGSPNLGSPLAALARRLPGVRRTLGPVLDELAVFKEAEAVRAAKRYEVGAVAGVTGWGLTGLLHARLAPDLVARFGEESDGKVVLSSALALADEAAIVPVGHAFLPTSRRVASCVVSYLGTGRFPEALRVGEPGPVAVNA